MDELPQRSSTGTVVLCLQGQELSEITSWQVDVRAKEEQTRRLKDALGFGKYVAECDGELNSYSYSSTF